MDAARAQLERFMTSLDAGARRLSPEEWGLELEGGGLALEVGLSLRDGFLRAQAYVLPGGLLDPRQLLFWNRQTPLVCFAQTGGGEVMVKGELPLAAVDAETLDTFLGLLVAAATRARELVLPVRPSAG